MTEPSDSAALIAALDTAAALIQRMGPEAARSAIEEAAGDPQRDAADTAWLGGVHLATHLAEDTPTGNDRSLTVIGESTVFHVSRGADPVTHAVAAEVLREVLAWLGVPDTQEATDA